MSLVLLGKTNIRQQLDGNQRLSIYKQNELVDTYYYTLFFSVSYLTTLYQLLGYLASMGLVIASWYLAG